MPLLHPLRPSAPPHRGLEEELRSPGAAEHLEAAPGSGDTADDAGRAPEASGGAAELECKINTGGPV